MEITTSPHRPASTPWGRLLVLVVILGPVTILVLLPIGLRLERYVMSGNSMDGSIDRGSVVFERAVPINDLRVGDVITYRPPASSAVEGMVTHRIVSIGPEGIVTQGDAEASPDPWWLHPEEPTMPRVVFTLPLVGYAYLVFLDPYTLLLGLVAAGVLALLLVSELVRRPRGSSAPDGVVTDVPVVDKRLPTTGTSVTTPTAATAATTACDHPGGVNDGRRGCPPPEGTKGDSGAQ
jgi:signal peptidase I